jgi:nicotinamidase-related amidase
MHMNDTALIIVDLQNDYFPGGTMELAGIEQTTRNAARILQHFRSSGRSVHHIRHISIHEGATFFLPGTQGSEIHAAMSPFEGESVIIKHFPNSFLGTELEKDLKEQSVKHLIICGAMSHMCIDATTRAAFDLGFGCMVAHNACATKDLDFMGTSIPAASVHAAFMAALNGIYARVISTEEIITSSGVR